MTTTDTIPTEDIPDSIRRDGEQWTPAPEPHGVQNGALAYAVSDRGRVFSFKSGCVLSPETTNRGYHRVNLYRDGEPKKWHVHRLTWAAFVGPIPENHHVHHVNGASTDNRLLNLDCVSPVEHVAHHHGVIDEATASYIKWAFEHTDWSGNEIADRFGVGKSSAYAIAKGKQHPDAEPIKPDDVPTFTEPSST